MFKFFSWLIIVSTVQFVQERTGSRVLLVVQWFSYLLILGFLGCFVDWVLSFKRYKAISGKKLAGIAIADVGADSNETVRTRLANVFAQALLKARGILVVLISFALTFLFVGAANTVTDRVIGALVEFQRQVK